MSSRQAFTDKAWVFKARLGVEQGRAAFQHQHAPAGGFHHGLGGGGIPFHGAAKARIEIGGPFRDAAEFLGRPDIHNARHMPAFQEAAHARVIGVVMAAHHHQPIGRGRAGADRACAGGVALEGAAANPAPEDLACRRQRHGAQHGAARHHQADIHREIVTPGGEFPRAVQRVHQPETLGMGGRGAGGDFFFGDYGNIRGGGAQPLHNQGFGDAISLRHRGMVRFPFHREARGLDGHNGGGRLGHEITGQGQQRIIIHAPCFGRMGAAPQALFW